MDKFPTLQHFFSNPTSYTKHLFLSGFGFIIAGLVSSMIAPLMVILLTIGTLLLATGALTLTINQIRYTRSATDDTVARFGAYGSVMSVLVSTPLFIIFSEASSESQAWMLLGLPVVLIADSIIYLLMYKLVYRFVPKWRPSQEMETKRFVSLGFPFVYPVVLLIFSLIFGTNIAGILVYMLPMMLATPLLALIANPFVLLTVLVAGVVFYFA